MKTSLGLGRRYPANLPFDLGRWHQRGLVGGISFILDIIVVFGMRMIIIWHHPRNRPAYRLVVVLSCCLLGVECVPNHRCSAPTCIIRSSILRFFSRSAAGHREIAHDGRDSRSRCGAHRSFGR